jgi:uncharacterized protein
MDGTPYHRNITGEVHDALADTPVVLINGPRQSGKSTLARQLTASLNDASYVTFDDPTTLALATADATGFLARLPRHAVIDEVQRRPEIFLPIKAAVDKDRVPGRFLLTGSANVMLLPRLSESLAGRMQVIPLLPLSQGEIAGHSEGFIDQIFGSEDLEVRDFPGTREGLFDRVFTGGYPEVLVRPPGRRREAWFDAYAGTVLQRDVADLANIEDLTALPRLLELYATRSGSLLNYSDVSRSMGLAQMTLRRYTALLRALFLIEELPAWSNNLGTRLIRTPKMYLNDSGLLTHLLHATSERQAFESNVAGPLLESFVLGELRKQVSWSEMRPRILFFRDHGGSEVDFVLEARGGQIVGIEVKASASPGPRAFRGLERLRELAGDRFVRGVLFYTGDTALPNGDRLWALPVSRLWTLGATVRRWSAVHDSSGTREMVKAKKGASSTIHERVDDRSL